MQPRTTPTRSLCVWCLKYLPLGLAVQAKLNYKDLNRQSDQFAAALAKLGVGKGSHVAIMLPNMPQQMIAFFGVLKAGAVVVNTNPTYPPHELEPLMRNSKVDTIVTLSGLYERVLEIQPKTAIKNIILTDIPDYVTRLFRNTVAKTVQGQRDDERCHPQARHLLDGFADRLRSSPGAADHVRCGRRHGSLPVHRRHDRHAQSRRADPS